MQQEIQLNIIPFAAPVEEAEFAFYTAKQDGYCPIYKDDLNGAIEGLVDESEAFTLINQIITRCISSAAYVGKALNSRCL